MWPALALREHPARQVPVLLLAPVLVLAPLRLALVRAPAPAPLAR